MNNWKDNNIEFILNQENRDKKRTASGAYHRASRRGYIRGGIRTQSDFLSAKEKRKLNGEVKVSNKYEILENIPKKAELKKMSKEQITAIFTTARKHFSNAQIMEQTGLSCGGMYGYFEKAGCKYMDKVETTDNHRKKASIGGKATNKGRRSPSTYKRDLEKLVISDDELIILRQRLGIPVRGQADIKFMRKDKQIELYSRLLKNYQRVELSKILEISTGGLDKALSRLDIKGITYNKKTGSLVGEILEIRGKDTIELNEPTINSKSEEVEVMQIDLEAIKGVIADALEQNTAIHKQQEEKEVGFTIKLAGVYKKEDIENKLLSIASILSSEKDYEINIELKEK
ncbi:MAG: hypothetical protein ACRC2K_13240 [Clostridium sp.]